MWATDDGVCLFEDLFGIELCNGSLCFVTNFRAEVNSTLQSVLVLLTNRCIPASKLRYKYTVCICTPKKENRLVDLITLGLEWDSICSVFWT